MRIKTVLISGILMLVLGTAVIQAETTTTFAPVADTWIQDANSVHGSDDYIGITGPAGGEAYTMGYMRFDLAGYNIDLVSSATLTLVYYPRPNASNYNISLDANRFALQGLHNVSGNTSQNWNEATLNQSGTGLEVDWPANTGQLIAGRFTDLDGDVAGITETATWNEPFRTNGDYWSAGNTTVTVTGSPLVAFINSRVDDDGLTTFIISGDRGYGLATRENATAEYRPVLQLTYSMAGASDPVPANDSTIVNLNLPQLCWTNSAGVGKCDVYFGMNEPNRANYRTVLTHIGTIDNPATSQCISIPAGMLPLTQPSTYYWAVDCYKGNPLPTEPNLPGMIWKFNTSDMPAFSAHPAEQIKYLGETAVFNVTATSSSTITYKWYRSTDNVNNTPGDDVLVGTNSSTLTLTNLAAANEGYYYCNASNTGGSTNSNTANLGVKRKAAHWTLEALVSGQYADSSGEAHNADVTGSPSFVAGAGATTGNGVTINASNGYASSGTWNPSLHTRQFTISLWANWTGQTVPTSWQGLIAKENAFGASTMMWQLEIDANNNNLAFKSGTSTLTSTPLPAGTWMHVVVVYDGTTARIYRNGVSAVSGNFVLSTKTDAPVILGASAKAADTGLFSSIFNGVLDDVQIYTYAMTQNETIDLYYAVTGLNVCVTKPTRDLSGDCLVNLSDYAMLAAQWLQCGMYPACP